MTILEAYANPRVGKAALPWCNILGLTQLFFYFHMLIASRLSYLIGGLCCSYDSASALWVSACLRFGLTCSKRYKRKNSWLIELCMSIGICAVVFISIEMSNYGVFHFAFLV